MDELFKVLLSDDAIIKEQVTRLEAFVHSEEYETDSIEMDASDKGEGNISSECFGPQILKVIKNFVQDNKRKLFVILLSDQYGIKSVYL